MHHCLHAALSKRYAWVMLDVLLSCVSHQYPSIWVTGKSFMKFGIKKSHEMISYILIGMTLLSGWIALLSEWKCRSSTKPCNLAQMTLDELDNKSHERFMLGKCQENASIGLKLRFKLYHDATLTWFELWLRGFAWQWNLNKSWSLSGV